jgi:hypothetical protein
VGAWRRRRWWIDGLVAGEHFAGNFEAIKLEALRKILWQISVLMLTINSSKILKASALYSIRGSR